MQLATWNVNSLAVRLPQVLDWLARNPVDVLCLQELKLTEDKFPAEAFRAAGYESAVFGQRSYNGVATLSRTPLRDVVKNIPGFADDQARVITATVDTPAGPLRVVNAYVVNGQEPGSEKFAYKMRWLEALRDWLRDELAAHPRPGACRTLGVDSENVPQRGQFLPDSPPHSGTIGQEDGKKWAAAAHSQPTVPKSDRLLVLMGDFNIAPEDRDSYDPEGLRETIHHTTQEREHFRALLQLGLVDAFRLFEQPEKSYSWWDYRMLAFPKNRGLRIDHILVSEALRPAVRACSIDRAQRKVRPPSDHAPVLVTLSF